MVNHLVKTILQDYVMGGSFDFMGMSERFVVCYHLNKFGGNRRNCFSEDFTFLICQVNSRNHLSE